MSRVDQRGAAVTQPRRVRVERPSEHGTRGGSRRLSPVRLGMRGGGGGLGGTKGDLAM